MVCIKCGREVGEDQVFCPNCLNGMEKYPIKPGTVVQIPSRPAAKKQPAHRPSSPEEQVAKLKKRVAVLSWLLVLMAALVIGLGWQSIVRYYEENLDELLPGQNYSAVTTTEAATEG